MSLRLAALDAYALLQRLFASDAYQTNPTIDAETRASWAVRGNLRTALGIDPIYAEHDGDLDTIAMLETLAQSLARKEDTAILGGAIIRAIGQHKAESLTKILLAAE